MHDEKYGREDKENVNKEACDVKRDEGKGPYKYKQQSKSKKYEAHPSPPTFMLARGFRVHHSVCNHWQNIGYRLPSRFPTCRLGDDLNSSQILAVIWQLATRR